MNESVEVAGQDNAYRASAVCVHVELHVPRIAIAFHKVNVCHRAGHHLKFDALSEIGIFHCPEYRLYDFAGLTFAMVLDEVCWPALKPVSSAGNSLLNSIEPIRRLAPRLHSVPPI
ncbi:MAG: hypothetical protein SOI38_03440 [Eggerthellaceae bacterium]|jgi:hypothetical protein